MTTLTFSATNALGSVSGPVEVRVGTDERPSPVFYDGFESGDHSHSENGYSWSNVSGSPDSKSGDGAPVFAGDWASRFRQDSSQRNRMIQLKAKTPAEYLTEFWFEYQIRIPDNYDHACSERSWNNKWTEFFAKNARNKLIIWSEMWKNSARDGGSRQTAIWTTESHKTITDNGITLADRGEYHRWRYYLKITTLAETSIQVHYKIWKDDTKLFDRDDIVIDKDSMTSEFHNIGVFQIMGWNNCQFPEQITWYVDEVMLYATDPGW